MTGRQGRETLLRQALEPLRDRYEYVIIDSPPSLGLLTVNTLAAADTVLIPIQCEYYALEGLTQLLNTVRLVQRGLNPSLPSLQIEGVLLTMFNDRLNLSRQVARSPMKLASTSGRKCSGPRSLGTSGWRRRRALGSPS
jgi:chromosome partitioning protein